jgi:hypothetical protein
MFFFIFLLTVLPGGLSREFMRLALKEITLQSIFHGEAHLKFISLDYNGTIYFLTVTQIIVINKCFHFVKHGTVVIVKHTNKL